MKRIAEMFGQRTVTLDGHRFVVRRPTTEEGVTWLNGIPALDPERAERGAPDPARVRTAIEKFLVSVDGEPYDAKADPPEGVPFAVSVPLYNAIYALLVPQDEAALAGRIL